MQRLGTDVYLERDIKGGVRANAWALAHCLIRSSLPTPMRLNGSEMREQRDCEQHIAVFRQWAGESCASSIIVSSESFSFLRTKEEAEGLDRCFKGLFEEIVPIIVFRDEDKRRLSWAKQLDNMGVKECMAKLDPIDRVDAEWYFDWKSLLGFWAQFGEPLTIDYRSALDEHKSILPAFLSTVNLDSIDLEGDFFLNETLNGSSGWSRLLGRMKRLLFKS